MSRADLAGVKLAKQDALSRWAVDYLDQARLPADRELTPMLEAAMERKYSGNPGEAFFTGGGRQSFSNFERWEGERIMTVREGFQHSVNLVFIRLMRDIVRHEMFHARPDMSDIFEDRSSPQRRAYLERFADRAGSAYMTRFSQHYRGKNSDQHLATLLGRVRLSTPHYSAVRLSATLLSARPALTVCTLLPLVSQSPNETGPDSKISEASDIAEGFLMTGRGLTSPGPAHTLAAATANQKTLCFMRCSA